MHIIHYAESVYFQFYRKIDEVNFFISEAVDNWRNYTSAPLPKDNAYFNKMQFVFSAFLSALVSSWEISKLSIQLRNAISGVNIRDDLKSESNLESDVDLFLKYFDVKDEKIFELFKFMKSARNASAHDGSLSLNGGNDRHFLFQTDLHRFKLSNNKVFIYEHHNSPKNDAMNVMLDLALHLVPVFESKLSRPVISREMQFDIAEFTLKSIKSLPPEFLPIKQELIEAMVESQEMGRAGRTTLEHIAIWKNIKIVVA